MVASESTVTVSKRRRIVASNHLEIFFVYSVHQFLFSHFISRAFIFCMNYYVCFLYINQEPKSVMFWVTILKIILIFFHSLIL
uniref:Ovule protein n=1 Tax=Romanomermis culicivorax TaxID=13658 RepID=A0A915JBK1_ROMCU